MILKRLIPLIASEGWFLFWTVVAAGLCVYAAWGRDVVLMASMVCAMVANISLMRLQRRHEREEALEALAQFDEPSGPFRWTRPRADATTYKWTKWKAGSRRRLTRKGTPWPVS